MIILVADGGGSKTRAWLAEVEPNHLYPYIRGERRLEPLAETVSGPSNPGQVGAVGLERALREIRTQMPDSGKAAHVVLGLAGVGREPERRRAAEVAQQVFSGGKVWVITDAELAYRGAFAGCKPGILLIAGTGTIAYYRTQFGHEFSRTGGWGPLLGDEGGGAWLGREALRHCLREFELDELSPLHASVLESLGIDTAVQILTKTYHDGFGPSHWASLAPLVFRHAREDLGALRILKNASIELVALAERLMERLLAEEQHVPMVVMGGLWEHRYHLQPLMEEEIRLRNLPLMIVEPVGGPLEGGVIYLHESGVLHS